MEQSLFTAVDDASPLEVGYVPVYVVTGAGMNMDMGETDPPRMLPVPKNYCRHDVFAVEFSGNTMEPEITDGSFVGVEVWNGQLEEGIAYLMLRPPFGYTVKRVIKGENDGLFFTSDNPSEWELPVPVETYRGTIKGKIVWTWKTVI